MRYRNNFNLQDDYGTLSYDCATGVTPGPIGSSLASMHCFSNGTIGLHIDEIQIKRKAEKIDRIVEQYEDIIALGRLGKFDTAADLLQHWLDGSGPDRNISDDWLRDFGRIKSAEYANRELFINSKNLDLAKIILNSRDTTFQDFWDSSLTANVFTELYYASGSSTITSRGKFTLDRSGQDKKGWVKISGVVEHHWWDPYDWHPGLTAFIEGFGKVKDSDAKFLEQEGYSKPFKMFAFWHQKLTGKYGIDTGIFKLDTQDLSWSDPISGRAPSGTAGNWAPNSEAMKDIDGFPLPGLSIDDPTTASISNTTRRDRFYRN